MDPVLYKAATSSTSIDLFTKNDPSFFLQETLEKNSALHLAAKFKQKQFAKKIVALHPQLLYQANSKGDTPLHIAASVGCLEIAADLIAIHLNTESREVEANKDLLTMQNLDKDTALHNAVRNDHFEIVKLMIEKDPELAGFINANEDSPLFLAVDRSHFKIARYILDKVPDCSYQGRNQMNALHAAILRTLYHKSESSLSVLDRNSAVAIEKMCAWSFLALAKMCPRSCLGIPAREGFTFMEAFIKECPSAIKKSDEFGWIPLHYAAFFGNTIAVELLLKNNDEQMPAHLYVYQKDNEGLSAFHIAAKEGQIQVMKKLTETCPDICELMDERGRTALHVAVENGMVDTVQYVLKTPSLEGLINAQDTEGNTSLHLAANYRHYEIVVKLLDDTRVDKKAMNKEGFTAIKIIVSKMELTVFQKCRIATKLWRAGGLQSVEGILRREDREKENVEMKERAGGILRREDREKENDEMKDLSLDAKRKQGEKIARTDILVATLIATVTFAAGFTMPGGYKNYGPDEGMAVLSRKTAFISFLLSDTIAFCFSATSIFFHFFASLQQNYHNFMYLISRAGLLTFFSLVAMVIAFISGTNVVLAGSSVLAIANIAVGYCFFLFFYLMIFVLS